MIRALKLFARLITGVVLGLAATWATAILGPWKEASTTAVVRLLH